VILERYVASKFLPTYAAVSALAGAAVLELRIASLGDHPIFAASCTIVLTAAILLPVWYLQDHLRELR
jgi:hypothetical protein